MTEMRTLPPPAGSGLLMHLPPHLLTCRSARERQNAETARVGVIAQIRSGTRNAPRRQGVWLCQTRSNARARAGGSPIGTSRPETSFSTSSSTLAPREPITGTPSNKLSIRYWEVVHDTGDHGSIRATHYGIHVGRRPKAKIGNLNVLLTPSLAIATHGAGSGLRASPHHRQIRRLSPGDRKRGR